MIENPTHNSQNEPRKPKGRIADIVTIASWLSGVDRNVLTGRGRTAEIARIRTAVYLVASEYGWSTPKIGAALKKDHTSVVTGRRKAQDYIQREPAFALLVDQLRAHAENMCMFIEDRDKPKTIEVIKWSKPINPPPMKKPRNDFSSIGAPDGGHLFHKGISKGSDKLTAALKAAMA